MIIFYSFLRFHKLLNNILSIQFNTETDLTILINLFTERGPYTINTSGTVNPTFSLFNCDDSDRFSLSFLQDTINLILLNIIINAGLINLNLIIANISRSSDNSTVSGGLINIAVIFPTETSGPEYPGTVHYNFKTHNSIIPSNYIFIPL